jgi:hypothetical protein
MGMPWLGGLREFSLNHFFLTDLMHEQPIDWLLTEAMQPTVGDLLSTSFKPLLEHRAGLYAETNKPLLMVIS